MRVRDLKWYILASLLIIVTYAAISVAYFLSVRSGKVYQSMKAIAYEADTAYKNILEEKIDSYYKLYIEDTNDSLTKRAKEEKEGAIFEVCSNQNIFVSYFPSDVTKKVTIARNSIINPSNDTTTSDDANFYLFLQKPSAGSEYAASGISTLTVRMPLEKLMEDVNNGITNDDTKYNTIIFDDTTLGLTAYTSFEADGYATGVYVQEILGDGFADMFEEQDGEKILNRTFTIDGKGYVVTARPLDVYVNPAKMINSTVSGYNFATVISTENVILGITWIRNQALIFYFAGVFAMIAMFVVLLLGCRKASVLLRVDRHAIEKTKSIVIRIDNQGNVIFTNKTFKELYGATHLNNINEFIDVETHENILGSAKANRDFECEVEIDSEKHYLHLTPIYLLKSYYLMGTDITTQYNRMQHLETMCGKNEYTHCDNGFMLENQYQTILENYLAYDVAFTEYNMDKYDEIINVFGRTNFNILLNQIYNLLKETYKDFQIYHVTDSKFIVIYPNTDINVITEQVSKSLEEFEKPFEVKENSIYVSVKVVIFNYKRNEYEKEGAPKITYPFIREKLDLAYRNISELSSKQYLVYEPRMDSTIMAADEMEKDIEEGIIKNEFKMWLQPQFDIVSNKVSGFEALIRWQNPKYIDKSPEIFIKLAEQRGHMLDIGRIVITESFKLAKKLEPYNTHVSVNVSPVQLLQVGFVQQLIDQFNSLELKEGSVAIEITETLLMGNYRLVNEKLKILKDRGFHIHLDDFCTGYSSMLYLKDLPVDTIKIDKEFTKYITNNKVNENIVRALCTLGNSLNLGIVCEGVESEEQSQMVKKMGCRTIQGYLIGKAMPYEDAVKLIEKYNTK